MNKTTKKQKEKNPEQVNQPNQIQERSDEFMPRLFRLTETEIYALAHLQSIERDIMTRQASLERMIGRFYRILETRLGLEFEELNNFTCDGWNIIERGPNEGPPLPRRGVI
jgi:hypothetical protein